MSNNQSILTVVPDFVHAQLGSQAAGGGCKEIGARPAVYTGRIGVKLDQRPLLAMKRY
jgi:hypothetical protein